ncbi:anti-sigma factor [Streptomyces minutiscleroticus]|uniref:Regulator of SigK n=1 Tax=Streptomyces minutiscleroticus TaxID=68238 RepID=A0A918U5F5_9ACTN|nr:anti-sigma factor [Streptomyces minutiscleroticus]GGX95335.1 hypothetical protein GCM10010358_56480 [Streptomyces minutiscleroticus]
MSALLRGPFGRRALHSLAAPYALDALAPPEHRRFERHLRGCDRCAAEVRALREDAVRLACSTAVAPPPALRERILAAVRTTPQEPVPQPSRSRPGRGPGRARAARPSPLLVPLTTLTAAAALVVAALFGVQAARTQDALDRERARASEIAHVLAAPDARASAGRDARGGGLAVVASAERRSAVVTATGLAAPGNGRVHQLWLVRPGAKPHSLGLLDGDTPLVATGLGTDATSLAVTVEPRGGSEQPTTSPIVQLALENVGFGE